MTSIRNIVYYCCVSKGSRVLYSYSCGDSEVENLAAMCLERTPSFHTWYFQTIRKKTFGFLMEDGYVYFTVVDEGHESQGVRQFLQHFKDEFEKVIRNTRKGSRGNISISDSICLEEQMSPVIIRLISSLEHLSHSRGTNLIGESLSSQRHPSPFPSLEGTSNSQVEAPSSTKMPLLGKLSKQEKKKMKERVVDVHNSSEGHHRSTERGIKIDVEANELHNQGMGMSGVSLQKSSSSSRMKTNREHARRMWWRSVRIILAIDLLVCLVLFGIWLGICRGLSCISH